MASNDRSAAADYGSTVESTFEVPIVDSAPSRSSREHPPEHLSTYTAGEDAGRLAGLAREFGLQRTREPRGQVRAKVADSLATLNLEPLKLWAERIVSIDQSYLEMRYRGVYFSARMHDPDITSLSSESSDEESLLLPPGTTTEGGSGRGRAPRGEADRSTSAADPHAAGLGGTLASAALGIIKGMVGPAILYLPHGFASAGYLVAVPVLALCTALFLWSSGCLLDSWRAESDRANRGKRPRSGGRTVLSYPELAYRAFGPVGERTAQVGISLMQSGVCLTYLIFVPQNLAASASLLLGWDVRASQMLALMVAAQVPLSWIRDIRRLTVTNIVANALILYGLVTCLGFAAAEVGGGTGESPGPFLAEAAWRARSLPAFNPSGWFLFLGTSVLLFEGSITLLVPLQEAVHTPEDRRRFPDLYGRVILGIVSFYAIFGVSCWMAFGNGVRTVMTTSLPSGTVATTVQLAYSLAVVFTFPLQNLPSLEIVCAGVEKMLAASGCDKAPRGVGGYKVESIVRRNAISTLMVLALSIVAILTMDDLDKVVSLMGSLLGCPLAFVLPPLIQNKLGKGQIGEWKRHANMVVAILGVGAMVVSSITTILKWD